MFDNWNIFIQTVVLYVYVKNVGKIPDQNLNVWVSSTPGNKVQILVESTGQIFQHLFWTLSPGFENNHKFKG